MIPLDSSPTLVALTLLVVLVSGLVALLLVLRRSGHLGHLRQVLVVRSQAPQAPKKTPLSLKIFAGAFLVVWLTLVVSAQLKVAERRGRFEAAARDPATTLAFSRQGRTLEVSGPEVARFFTLVGAAEKPGAHHSHPVAPLRLRMGETCYEMGRDSQEPDELWLTQVEPPATFGDPTLWRLRSTELFAWFAKIDAQLQ